MMRMIATCLLAITIATSAWAEPRDWVVDAAGSRLSIVYEINGNSQRGEFSAFSGQATFDKDAITEAEMVFLIETGTIDTGEAFGTEVVKGVDWLDTVNQPTAQFVLRSLEPVEGDLYRIGGDLSLRGKTEAVTGEMRLELGDTNARATGKAIFDRRKFRVGVGFTTLFVDVGDEVTVEFDLAAKLVE